MDFHPHRVEAIERAEGYRELRCLPSTWTYPSPRPLGLLLTDLYSARMGVDPYGMYTDPEFWSGSDAALRLRSTPHGDLALRELAALASRRSTGLNAPKPWVAWPEVRQLATQWEPEATGVHFSQVPVERAGPINLWEHYGMEAGAVQRVVAGYYMTESEAPLRLRADPWHRGPGTWYSWRELLGWERWRRRQEAAPSATEPEAGRLLLFVSHRWEGTEHPDPEGAQLLCLKAGLTMALAAAILHLASSAAEFGTRSGLPEVLVRYLRDVKLADVAAAPLQAWARAVQQAAENAADERTFWAHADKLDPPVREQLDAIQSRILVWYDYASMFQSPRTAAEEREFRREILELNAIQRHAATVVIAGNHEYESRAWCFLELCGGMRQEITELTPSWGEQIGASESGTTWATRSDQLIGALNVLGPDAIQHSGLDATDRRDLEAIAHLLRDLPLIGRVESDDSDLIGGVLPVPFRDGKWVTSTSPVDTALDSSPALKALPDHGRVPADDVLQRAADECAGLDSLAGPVGMWVYTSQRVLSLAWAARAHEIWAALRVQLADDTPLAPAVLGSGSALSVGCMWADARGLADDGLGWTRSVPSTVALLVVVTQADLPRICRIHERVVGSHLACGVPVVTFSPETGRFTVQLPTDGDAVEGRAADVLAVPRLRRSSAYPRQMLIESGTAVDDLEAIAALRLDPSQGPAAPGEVGEAAAEAGLGPAGRKIMNEELRGYSERRVRAEALARCTAATWGEWCLARLHQSAWSVGLAPLQVDLIEQLVRRVFTISDNPFKRRKLLDIIVEEHKGYALPPSILDDADELIALIVEKQAREP